MMTILLMFDYGDVIYKMASKCVLWLDVLHHSGIHFASGAPFSNHHYDLHKLKGWPSLHIRWHHRWLLLVYKTLLGKTPQYLSNLMHLSHNNYHLRSSDFYYYSVYFKHLHYIWQVLLFCCSMWMQLLSTLPLNFQLFHHSMCLNRNWYRPLLTVVPVDSPFGWSLFFCIYLCVFDLIVPSLLIVWLCPGFMRTILFLLLQGPLARSLL